MVVMHVEEGSEVGTAATFADTTRHASAHYGIGKNGLVDQFVADCDTAWHAGNGTINRRSLGIEMEGFTASFAPTIAQMSAAIELVGTLCMKYTIPIDRQHIIGHSEVPDPIHPGQLGGANNHTDPGPNFDINGFVAAVAAFVATPQAPSTV